MTEPGGRSGTQADIEVRSYLLFEVANLHLASVAAQVDRVHDALVVEPVDGTLAWFSGLAVADGKLLPVTDLGAILGAPVADGYTLQLHRDIGVAGIRVQNVIGIFKRSTTLGSPDRALPELLSASVDERVIAFRGRLHHLLDFHALLQSPRLLTIADSA